jgi:hypothetical protein
MQKITVLVELETGLVERAHVFGGAEVEVHAIDWDLLKLLPVEACRLLGVVAGQPQTEATRLIRDRLGAVIAEAVESSQEDEDGPHDDYGDEDFDHEDDDLDDLDDEFDDVEEDWDDDDVIGLGPAAEPLPLRDAMNATAGFTSTGPVEGAVVAVWPTPGTVEDAEFGPHIGPVS